MHLDLRKPIALLFLLYGGLLLLYGWIGTNEAYARCVDRGWGAILSGFGLLLGLLALRWP